MENDLTTTPLTMSLSLLHTVQVMCFHVHLIEAPFTLIVGALAGSIRFSQISFRSDTAKHAGYYYEDLIMANESSTLHSVIIVAFCSE